MSNYKIEGNKTCLYDVFVLILNTIIELAQIKKEIIVTKAIGTENQILA